jgi:antibiotic biosynthesis monooxygenase (ABM) superfamily enzyme
MTVASRLRLAFVLALGVYPVVTFYLYLLAPLSAGWSLWQRTLVLVPLMVVTIVFAVTPLVNRLFGRFIAGRPAARAGA